MTKSLLESEFNHGDKELDWDHNLVWSDRNNAPDAYYPEPDVWEERDGELVHYLEKKDFDRLKKENHPVLTLWLIVFYLKNSNNY